MLLPILYNHRLLGRLDRNPEFVIEVQEMPEDMTISKFKEFVKDPLNGQVYKFTPIISGDEFPSPEGEYWMWLDGYGQGAPAKYEPIPRSLYQDIALTPPFVNRTSDIDLAILLYGFSAEGRRRRGGTYEHIFIMGNAKINKMGRGVPYEENEFRKITLEYLSNDMMYVEGWLNHIPDKEKEIIIDDKTYGVRTYKKGNRRAVMIWHDSYPNIPLPFCLVGDYEIVMETTGRELAPDNQVHLLGTSDVGRQEDADGVSEGHLTIEEAKEIMNLASGTKPELTKKEEAIISEAEKELKEEIQDPLEKFLDEKEETLDKAVKKGKKEQVETREKEFTDTKDVCKDELKDAITDAAHSDTDAFVEQDIHSEVTDKTLNKAQKAKNQILSSPTQITIPPDATYQYSLFETSQMYNQPIARMEMEAYFYAHPELDYIQKEVIGDYIHTKEELMQDGLLLYNSQKEALAYRYEYLNGNIYTILELYTDQKDKMVVDYGEEAYKTQLDNMEASKPTPFSITSPDVKLIPFIHPLTEQIVSYTMLSTKSKMFTAPQDTKDPNATREPLKLSILVFFMDWVNQQIPRLNEFGLTYIEELKMLYFRTTSYKRFGKWFEDKTSATLGKGKKAGWFQESMFIERKDNAKRMVNNLFQEFLKQELEEGDQKSINYIFNKSFNGYIHPNTEKLPIFIRHSKYFKNFKKFQLSSIQVKSIKFSTLNNSSILAHEVGYGKTLASLGFISHMFETHQATNILTVIPKTLYENNKWREEAIGKTDDQGNPVFDKASGGYVIGGFPMYNLIGVGNLTERMVFKGGSGGLKNYTPQEIKNINLYKKIQIILEKPSAQASSFVTPPREWKKILEQLKATDKNLYDKFRDDDIEAQLELFLKFGKKSTKQRNHPPTLDTLIDNILKLEFMKSWVLIHPGLPFKPSVFIDHREEFAEFRKDALASIRKQIHSKIYSKIRAKLKAQGKKVKGVPGKKLSERRATDTQVRMGFLGAYDGVDGVLDELHAYVNDLAGKMRGYSIYQYGTFNFKRGENNIILATREALDNVGFSISNIDSVRDTINLVTTYLNEGKIIGEKQEEGELEIELDVEDASEERKLKQSAEKTLSAQLQQMLDIILKKMTEAGATGKFELEQLSIDGFVLDEAHMAKKLFTRVKTDASVQVINERGKITRVRYSSHDIQGGKPPEKALKVFGVTAYIHSLGGKKPVMFLTATPFTNHPTEIFSMLAMVGMKQLQAHGLSNIKNFFDMFIKETLIYDFNHKGEYVKKVVIEDFRNKAKLQEMIWSIMDIRRGAGDSPEDREMSDLKPKKNVIPRFNAQSLQSDEDKPEDISTVILNRATPITSSIIDRNSHQIEMLEGIEKWLNNEVTEKSICPKFQLFAELEEQQRKEREEVLKEAGEELGEEFVIGNVDEEDEMTKKITHRTGFGKTFKALGMARSICLSPYFYQCNDLPYPTAENFVKYSPKIEYVIKCIKSVKDWHIKNEERDQISGQVIYTNMLNFKYTYKDDTGIIRKDTFNLAKLMREYMVDKGIFDDDEIDIIASNISPTKRDGKKRNREIQIKDFQQGRTKVLIGSPAIREGVDLQHNASVLYILTPDWNPTDMRQIEGRIWRRDNRFAQIRVVYALMDNSIEVFIYAKLGEKARRLEKVMKEPNAVEELVEMSLDPKLTTIALVSDPKKRADVITKEEELETTEQLRKLYQDHLLIKEVSEGIPKVEDAINEYKKVFMRYQEAVEKVSNEVADWKIQEIKKWKVADPTKLLNAYGEWVSYPFILESEKAQAGFYVLERTDLTEKEVLAELERRRVVHKKKKEEILAPMKDRLFGKNQKPLSTKVDDLEKEIAGMLIEERKKINHDILLEAYNTGIRQMDDKRYEGVEESVFNAMVMNEQASSLLEMARHLEDLLDGFKGLRQDIQEKIKNGEDIGYPTLYSIIPLTGAKANKKSMGNLINIIRTTLSRFNTVDYAYLQPRGLLIADLPKVIKEIEASMSEKEKIIQNLEQKRIDLVDKFERQLAGRKNYEIDDLVRSFGRTNVVLAEKFAIKD